MVGLPSPLTQKLTTLSFSYPYMVYSTLRPTQSGFGLTNLLELIFAIVIILVTNIQIFVTKITNTRIYSFTKTTIFVFEYLIFGQNYSNIRIYSNIRSSLIFILVIYYEQQFAVNNNKVSKQLISGLFSANLMQISHKFHANFT